MLLLCDFEQSEYILQSPDVRSATQEREISGQTKPHCQLHANPPAHLLRVDPGTLVGGQWQLHVMRKCGMVVTIPPLEDTYNVNNTNSFGS